MRKFSIHIVLFILPIILLGYFIDIFISTNLKKSNSFVRGEFPVWNAIFEGRASAEIAVYGSSRAWVHFNSTMLEDSLNHPTYNFGIDGQAFQLQYLRHVLFLQHNTAPKIIIHSIDISTLQQLKELYNGDQFLPYMLWNKDIEKYTGNMEGFDKYDFNIPLVRFYDKTSAIKHALKLTIHPEANEKGRVKGYLGQDIVWNGDFDKAKLKMKRLNAHIDTSTLISFDRYLNECKQKNIRVVLVWSPEFIEGQKFVSNREVIVDIYKRLSTKYNIPFFDFSNDEICYQKKYFYNSQHMNKKGSDYFTRKLIKKIKEDNRLTEVL